MRRAEADAFYAAVQSGIADADQRLVQRQAFAGMLWCKQFYGYDVRRWLQGDRLQPPPPSERSSGRNANWRHLAMGDIGAFRRATSYRCPTRGNIPGSPPGISRFNA